ncbi:MAG: RHS repeat domain-containing protein [Thermoguttaceae bacterium]
MNRWKAITWTWDKADRPKSVFDNDSACTCNQFARLVSLDHFQDPNDPLAQYTWTYKGGGRVAVNSAGSQANPLAGFRGLSQMSLRETGTVPLAPADHVWKFDAAFTGLITRMTSPDGVAAYSYDARGQLTGASYDYQPGGSYSYDANGNRTNPGCVTGAYNRLLSDGTYNYEYDAEGNRTKRTDIVTGAVTEYVWDHRNRLVSVIDRASDGGPILQSVEYAYDSQNRWIAKSIDADGDGPEDATSTYFVYDGNQIILQIDAEGQVTNRYLWGPAVDQILADEQVQFDGSSAVLWTLTDHLNTVRDLAVQDAETGVTTIANHIVYDAFGRVTSQTNPTVATLFGFTARPFDRDTGLQNNLNRWYDAETGTWISEDPKGFAAADANLYRYVGNEVTTTVDPTGLQIVVEWNPPPRPSWYPWWMPWYDSERPLDPADLIMPLNVGGKVVGKAVGGIAAKKGAARVTSQLHHSLPKFLGGYCKQILSKLSPSIHGEFHSLLAKELKAKGIPLNVSGVGGSMADWAFYFQRNPGAQKKACDAVLDVSRRIDAKHGMAITQDVWQNLVEQKFTPYP